MSRGIGLGSVKEIKKTVKSVCYDNSDFLLAFTGTDLFKIDIKNLVKLKQKEIDIVVNTEWNSNTITRNYIFHVCAMTSFSSPVKLGHLLFVAENIEFTKFVMINLQTMNVYNINTPVKMKSNLLAYGNKLFMVSARSEAQTDDRHKLFFIDTFILQDNVTQTFNSTNIITKKQNNMFYIWHADTDDVFVSNWTDFSCSVFSKITGAYTGKFSSNGYPGTSVNVGDGTAILSSFGGMLSRIDGTTHQITNLAGSIRQINDPSSSGFVYVDGQIWFHDTTSFGRLILSSKEVNDSNEDFLDTSGNKDIVILKNVDIETVDQYYTKQLKYKLSNSNYKSINLEKQFTYVDINSQTQTEPARIFLCGSALTIINPNEVKFVFDKPEVKPSMIFCTGNGMITTGDTGYIGEFG